MTCRPLTGRLNRLLPPAALAAGLACAGLPEAWAARPLSTDDAAAAEPATWQAEAWLERQHDARGAVLALAAGVLPGLELGLEYGRPDAASGLRYTLGPSLKWVPAGARVDTAAGPLAFGLRLALDMARADDSGLRSQGQRALLLASWQPDAAWAVHANLGQARDSASGTTAGLWAGAVAWSHAALQLHAELRGNTRHAVFGGTERSAGARWWLKPEALALDVSASREAGAAGTRWTLGFGAYGLGF